MTRKALSRETKTNTAPIVTQVSPHGAACVLCHRAGTYGSRAVAFIVRGDGTRTPACLAHYSAHLARGTR